MPFNKALKSFAFLSIFYLFLISFTSSLVHEYRVENAQLEYELYAADQELASTREALLEEIIALEKKANRDNVKDSYEQNKMSLNTCGGNVGLYEPYTYTCLLYTSPSPRDS